MKGCLTISKQFKYDFEKCIYNFLGSSAPAKLTIASKKEAQELLDEVNERCSMTYRAPELFNIDIDSVIDERIDVWVSKL